MITRFFLGGGEARHLGGGGFYPSNTLDRTLAGRVYNFLHVRPKQGLICPNYIQVIVCKIDLIC